MQTLIDLVVLNWAQLIILVTITVVFAKKEAWLAKTMKQHQNLMFAKCVMTAVIILGGVSMILGSSLGLRVQQHKHDGELRVKDTEIRLLNEEIEYLESK